MLLVEVVILDLFTGVHLVNKGRLKTRRKEITYGDIVDYSSMKRNYPFMSRIILDDLKCGGALISDRCYIHIRKGVSQRMQDKFFVIYLASNYPQTYKDTLCLE